MKSLLLLASVLVLASCGVLPHGETRYETTLVTPPDALLAPCPVAAPPNKDIYLQADWPEKERLLAAALHESYENTAVCNTGKTELRAWKQKQKALYAQ